VISAIDASGRPIDALNAPTDDGYTCPECADPVSLCAERSLYRDPYFAHGHDPYATCSMRAAYAPESFEHLRAKTILADALRQHGYTVFVEETHDSDNANRQPDLSVYSRTRSNWVAIEVQHSAITVATKNDRSADHRTLGAIGTIWVWIKPPRFVEDGIVDLSAAMYDEWNRTLVTPHLYGRTVEETPDGYIERLAVRLLQLSDRRPTGEPLPRQQSSLIMVPAVPEIVLCRDRHQLLTPRLSADLTIMRPDGTIYREPTVTPF
jgi:hypothetical protein